MTSPVTDIAPAAAGLAVRHFGDLLALETDCSDVYQSEERDFVLVDVRSAELFASGHCGGAINIPHRELTAERLAEFDGNTCFVVYCAGPHCNGADKGALRLALLDRPVKKMIGGVTGWIDEGYPLHTADTNPAAASGPIECGC